MLFLHLPPEIISLILVTLPVKTLSILKCVCIYFSRLISSPDFIGAHLTFSCEDASMSGYRIIVRSSGADSDSKLAQISIPSLCRESSVHSINLDFPKKELVKIVRLVGSCNGLVVIIVNWKHMFLWNPAIRKHKKVPNIGKHANLCMEGVLNSHYGFGFDVSNGDYKVVALVALKCTNSGSKKVFSYVVCVYSLKRSYWRRIPDLMGEEFIGIFGKFASGQLHWSTKCGDVVSFDVEREVFGTLEQPNYAKGFDNVALSVLGGSFCLSYVYDTYVDVWVMKEYGKKESWTKIISLSGFIFAYPRSILPNGEVLMDELSLCIFNPIHNSCRSSGIRNYLDPLIYVESLVSPCCN